ncbi:MAG TPA: tetratricopeptide repeat protein [Polyangia bacterium]|nr:tetratricopeptide repeat protein [Polyangia bacterium]
MAPDLCAARCFAQPGEGRACATYGLAVMGVADAPVRLKVDIPTARRAFQRGCALGDLDSCGGVQDLDYDYAEDGAMTACNGWLALCARGHQRSCVFGGGCLMHEAGFPQDVERGLALIRAACQTNEKVGCRSLAFAAEDGKYMDADPAAAFALMKRACDMDDPLACAHLGRFYEHGVGTRPDPEAARRLYRASCARGIKRLPCQALERLGEKPPPVQEK